MKKAKKAKKVLLILIIAIIALCTINIKHNTSYADSDSSQTLKNVVYNIQMNTDGSIDVEEKWKIKIEETNTLFKQFKVDSTKYSSITNGSVSIVNNGVETKLTDSKEYAYHVPVGEYYFLNRGSYYEVAWGTGLANSSGTKEYILRYHVTDAIAKYNDVAELYWQAFGSDFEIPINKLTGTITLPGNATTTDEIKVWGHTPDLNGIIKVDSTNKISFEINDNKSKKMIEVRTAIPTKLITSSGRTYNKEELNNITDEETNWSNSANAKRTSKLAIFGVICFLVFGALTFVLVKNIKVIRTTTKLKPTQKLDYFRELPRENATPSEAKYIINGNYKALPTTDLGPLFMATILDLSLKKAIKLNQVTSDSLFNKEDTEIEIITDNVRNCTTNEDEISVFNFIKRACSDNKTTTKELKKFISSHSNDILKLKESLDSDVTESLLSNKILDKDGINKKSSLWYNTALNGVLIFIFYMLMAFSGSIINMDISMGVFLATIIFIIIDIIIGKIAKGKIDAYTQSGIDEQEKWKAFKKYMEDFSLLKEKNIPDLILWEKYLVYAAAFGIADKVIKQLKVEYPEYSDNSFAMNYTNMYFLMNTNFSNSFDSVSSAMSSTFSSGSGAGGGFSGGGGGGGGRRWRRRSLDFLYYQHILICQL